MKVFVQDLPIDAFFQYPYGNRMCQLVQRMDVDGKTVIYYITERGGNPHRRQFAEPYLVHHYTSKTNW